MMFRSIAAAAVAATLFPLTGLAQTSAPPASAPPVSAPPATVTAPAKPGSTKPMLAQPSTPKVYVPGLQHFMNAILTGHNKLWFAGRARNWPLAAYELGKIKEVMGDVQDYVPVFKNLPLAQMLDAVIVKEIAGLEKAIEAKDVREFSASFDRLNEACNACHKVTESGFVVIKRPTRAIFTNQEYRPPK